MKAEFEKYEAEAKEKWGETDAYKEYEERSKDRSDRQQTETAEGMDGIMAEFASRMKEGDSPDSPRAQRLVNRLQDYITDNLYICTDTILAGLGRIYTEDERFRKEIDKHADGTAAFVSAAIAAYCENSGRKI